jgi:hypothetical protein
MPAELKLDQEAESDIVGAYGWYEGRRAGLGGIAKPRFKDYRPPSRMSLGKMLLDFVLKSMKVAIQSFSAL